MAVKIFQIHKLLIKMSTFAHTKGTLVRTAAERLQSLFKNFHVLLPYTVPLDHFILEVEGIFFLKLWNYFLNDSIFLGKKASLCSNDLRPRIYLAEPQSNNHETLNEASD